MSAHASYPPGPAGLTGSHEGQSQDACNTAEPSGELSVGDLVAVGEVPLAVARLGWTPVSGGLNEARTDEHGTHPLPAAGPASAAGPT